MRPEYIIIPGILIDTEDLFQKFNMYHVMSSLFFAMSQHHDEAEHTVLSQAQFDLLEAIPSLCLVENDFHLENIGIIYMHVYRQFKQLGLLNNHPEQGCHYSIDPRSTLEQFIIKIHYC